MWFRKKPELAVQLLLARLDKAKEHALSLPSDSIQFGGLKAELQSISDVFPDIKKWEKTTVDQLYVLEQELDDDIFNDPEKKAKVLEKLNNLITSIGGLKESIPRDEKEAHTVSTIKPTDDDHCPAPGPEWANLGVENNILQGQAMSSFLGSFHFMSGSEQAKMCSLCLSVFLQKSVIQKKPLIYWWIGEGLVMKTPDKTAEEVGEQVFKELVDEGFISASKVNKSLSVNSFVIHPWIHRMLIKLAKDNSFSDFSTQWTPCTGKQRAFLWQGNDAPPRISGEREADNLVMVFNVNDRYLGDKLEWISKLRNVEVLQMGRWQHSDTHHIEVEEESLLNSLLGSQTHLKYLSLRGISRIETLPASISKLISLQILDLRACHNLENLPPSISRLRNLTHLDVSHCYLLESMPKGLEQLQALQVVKGFVIGKAERNSCKISDLSKLNNLRKLSIRVGETQHDDQLGNIRPFLALRILTISWGNVSSAEGKPISLPENLTKLDLRCVPFVSMPGWLFQANLPSQLDKLYIKGGKLKSLKIGDGQVWEVQYLRFRYLDDLNQIEGELANYDYLDKFDCYRRRPDTTSTRAA